LGSNPDGVGKLLQGVSMTSNLQEFLIVGALVGGVTTFILGFRLTIIHLENEAREYIKKRQPELDALSAKIEQSRNKTA
jgi:hypothetical protein